MSREEAYRFYMTEMLRIAAGDIRGRDGLPSLYNDIINKKDDASAPDDPEEIINRIMRGINKL